MAIDAPVSIAISIIKPIGCQVSHRRHGLDGILASVDNSVDRRRTEKSAPARTCNELCCCRQKGFVFRVSRTNAAVDGTGTG